MRSGRLSLCVVVRTAQGDKCPNDTRAHERPVNRSLKKYPTKTMDEMDYKVEIMCGCGDCYVERADLTREDFIALKKHLAKIRGIALRESTHA
jgi:hypothetical protein